MDTLPQECLTRTGSHHGTQFTTARTQDKLRSNGQDELGVGNITSKKLELLWNDYFKAPSEWLDNRKSKTNQRSPDFEHKTTREPLWIYGWFNPSWVQEELRRRRLQPSAKDGLLVGKKMAKRNVAGLLDTKVEELGRSEHRNNGASPSDVATRVSYLTLLKACAEKKDLEKGSELHSDIVAAGSFHDDVFVGSALVNMYAKCGALSKAQEVFDELPICNVVLWNALLGGYAQYGHFEKLLNCFENMQLAGFLPDAITFAYVLSACGSIGAADKGEEIHMQIAKDGVLLGDSAVATALVDMYARCGLLEKAQAVFDELPVKTVVSWNALIAGYIRDGQHDQALKWFECMHKEDVSPNVITILSILKASGNSRNLVNGQELHARIVREGFLDHDITVGTSLVGMYAKCGALSKAEEVFEELPARNVVSWNALIAGFSQHGHGAKTVNCFERMQIDGLSPDASTLTCTLKACGTMEATDKGPEIHADIVKEGLLDRDVAVGGALVDMYSKWGAVLEAQEVFDELPMRNVVVWTALMGGYVHYGPFQRVLNCFERMLCEGFMPDAATFACIFKACGSIGAANRGQELHAGIVKDGLLDRNIVASTALIDMYGKCDLLDKAQEVFNGLLVQNVVSWNALISGYAQNGLAEHCLNYFEQMKLEGFIPDSITFLCVLKSCGSLDATHRGREIHAEIVKDGLVEEDIAIGTALVAMYAKCGILADAQDLFDELPLWDTISWNALISGYAQHKEEEALECLVQMQMRGCAPDPVTFAYILKACSSIGATCEGRKVHGEVVRKGLVDDMAVSNALITMYAGTGMLAEAQDVFEKLEARDVGLWNALALGHTQFGKDKAVFCHFDRMVGEGTTPNPITFTHLLNTCSHQGLLEKGQACFEIMNSNFGFFPTLEHYTCMVGLFCRAGHLEMAIVTVEGMAFFNDSTVWHTLLGACEKWLNIQLGNWVLERALQVDKTPAAAYVCMSNIHVAVGRQDDDDDV